jgi:hypothetical protein
MEQNTEAKGDFVDADRTVMRPKNCAERNVSLSLARGRLA